MSWKVLFLRCQRYMGMTLILIGGACSQPPNNVLQIDVTQQIEQGNYQSALKTLNEALIQNPRDPNLLYNLALIQNLQGKTEEAYKTLNRASRYTSRDDSITLLQAELTLEMGDADQAWDHFVQLSTLGKQNARAQMLKGMIHAELGDWTQAEGALRAAMQLNDQDPAIAATAAFVLASQGRSEEAETLINKAESLLQVDQDHSNSGANFSSPNALDTRLQIGETYLLLGDAQKAADIADNLKPHAPEDAQVHSLLGKAEMTLLNFGKAESAFSRALTCPNATPWTKAHYAVMLFAAQREEEAFTRAKEAETELEVSEQPVNNPMLYNLLATLYARRDQILMAQNYLARSLEINSNQPKVLELMEKIAQKQ